MVPARIGRNAFISTSELIERFLPPFASKANYTGRRRMGNLPPVHAFPQCNGRSVQQPCAVLEMRFLLELFLSWQGNRPTRMMRKPGAHNVDTALASMFLALVKNSRQPVSLYDRGLTATHAKVGT